MRRIPRDNRHSVNQRGRSDQPISNWVRIWHVESCASQSDGHIDGQDPRCKRGQDIAIEPRPQYQALRWIAAFYQQNTDFKFLNRNCRQE
jgi:hypothetical protein